MYGGYATHVVRGAEHWVKVPDGLDDVQAVSLILNYVTAYQMIHRKARLQPGQSALVNAANGGVGQALLDLLRAHGVSAIGAAAKIRHEIVSSYGAIPIEGRLAPLDAGVHRIRPAGVDAAFDGVGGSSTRTMCVVNAAGWNNRMVRFRRRQGAFCTGELSIVIVRGKPFSRPPRLILRNHDVISKRPSPLS